MKKGIISIVMAILSLLTVSGQVTFTGVGPYPVIEVTPAMGTGLDKIYVIYNTNGVGMTYHSSSGELAVWFSYDSRGADYAEEITDISCDSSVTSLSQVLPNSGYIIVEGNQRYCFWVVNYADYYLELNDMYFNPQTSCDLLSFNVDGHADAIPYYTTDGRRQVLDREIKLSYNTLIWNDDDANWWEQRMVETFAALDQDVEIVPPLCDTDFMLTGDRFLEEWGIEIYFLSEYFQTQAVSCGSTVEPNDFYSELGGWAPCRIVFKGYPTDAVVYRAWEMATDADFENVIKWFDQDEVEYTFMEAGTYYLRYMVTNADGSCKAYGKTYAIKVKSFPIRGDINGDREVNIADINALIGIILGSDVSDYVRTRADVNNDGEVSIADINVIIYIILKGQPAVNTIDWVDLGLPSGTLWATCNVGANSPAEYGDYFAWGETFSKDYYDWTTYKWCNGSIEGINKYSYGANNINFMDFKGELEPEDDVAYVHWGPSWRMPSYEQQKELAEQCTWTWTTQNGVNGYLVIGQNGNSIFLPATGYRWKELFDGAGSFGTYWSRTLYMDYSDLSFSLGFDSSHAVCGMSGRCNGNPVRAVRVTQN